MFACQGASFTKISTFSAPGTLRANHARASRHLGVCFGGTLNLEGIYGHFGCFTVDFGKGTISRVCFLDGFYSSFSPGIMKTLESHSDLKTFSYGLKARKNNPKTPDLGFATGFPYPAGQAPPKGERSSTATWSGKIWGLWIRRDESIWRINEKNGDLQNYTCAAYVNMCINQ